MPPRGQAKRQPGVRCGRTETDSEPTPDVAVLRLITVISILFVDISDDLGIIMASFVGSGVRASRTLRLDSSVG